MTSSFPILEYKAMQAQTLLEALKEELNLPTCSIQPHHVCSTPHCLIGRTRPRSPSWPTTLTLYCICAHASSSVWPLCAPVLFSLVLPVSDSTRPAPGREVLSQAAGPTRVPSRSVSGACRRTRSLSEMLSPASSCTARWEALLRCKSWLWLACVCCTLMTTL